ncbi:hypothetical protein ACQKP0_19595 [Heyndrickxia sp. NPDC080065]|uniref:hypothetical protein n=1 Tax=Heyndrickxia sp. NPDC080065 TaxID=3390568 RepID=UPI003CFFEE3B
MKLLKKWTLFVAMIIIFPILIVKPIYAKESIQIKVEAGINGSLKSERGFPVYITIKNNGEDFKGDLLIDFAASYNSSGSKAIHVELPAGMTKKFVVSVPGLLEDIGYDFTKKPIVHLYKGSWKNGDEVKGSGSLTFSPKFAPQTEKSIGILSENPDRLKELKTIQPNFEEVGVYTLSKSTIPPDALGLELFDYIFVDEYAVTQLDESQQRAIQDWIKNGGVLISGATPNGLQSFGILKDDMPMNLSKETKIKNLSFLEVNKNKKPPFNELPVFTGELKDQTNIITKVDNIPLIVNKKVGNGEIWQTAFSLGDEPLSTWQGYHNWLGFLLTQAKSSQPKSMFNSGGGFFDSIYYEFAEVNELFPSSQFSIGTTVMILVCYFLLIVPILYFVLKKLDKREHSWWIIPVISIVVSMGIFFTGAKDRISKPQINQMGTFEANGNGQLFGLFGTSLMSNKGGDYVFSFPKGQFNAIPINGRRLKTDNQTVIENKLNTDQFNFNNVEYWSTRSLLGFVNVQIDGEFLINLSLNNQKLVGKIENQFPYDFEKVYIWTGDQTYSLGKLKKGESVTVNEKMNEPYLSAPIYSDISGGYSQINNVRDISKMKMERLEGMAGLLSQNYNKENQPVIYGITSSPVVQTKLENKTAKINNLSLIYQPFTIGGNINGPFTLNQNSIRMSVSVIKGNIMEGKTGKGNDMMLDDGEYEITYQLPQQMNVEKTIIQEFKIQLEENRLVDYSIYDFSKGKYVSLNQKNKVIIFDNTPDRYYSNGNFKIKLTKTAQGDPHVNLPEFTVKGEVRP